MESASSLQLYSQFLKRRKELFICIQILNDLPIEKPFGGVVLLNALIKLNESDKFIEMEVINEFRTSGCAPHA